ncbi:MAG: Uma2 family endonuclease [Deltaproteobacteria bacterium]|nr:Uma2 family endonuclease [Deltaproteobacteria bacterium]
MIEPVVSTSPLVRRYTLEEFFALPAPGDGSYYELIAGVLYMSPPPGLPHALSTAALNRILARYCDAHPERCTLFIPRTAIATANTYLEPDLFLVRNERLGEIGAGILRCADLVIEVLSPGSAAYDSTTKADTYAALGVSELWLVDLKTQSIEQRVLHGATYTTHGPFRGAEILQSAVFEGLAVRPDELFPRPDRG